MRSRCGGRCAYSSTPTFATPDGRTTWRLKKRNVSRACVLAAFMVKTARLPGKNATKTLFRWANKVSKSINKMYSFEYVLKSDEELGNVIGVKRIYDVVKKDKDKRRSGDHSVFSLRDIERESKRTMRENAVIAAVTDLHIHVVILKKGGYEKITINEGGACRAARKNNSFFVSESSEMEVILFENI